MSCLKCNNTVCTCPPTRLDTYSGISKALKNYKLESPIPDEVRDVTKLQNWFRKQGYIPFAGTTQDSNHTYLRYLQNLAKLSPTLASCINGIKFYAFTGKPNIIKSVNSEFDFSDSLKYEELSLDTKNKFVQKLSLIDKGNMSWSQLAIALYNSFKGVGNAYLSITIKTILDQKYISFKYHEPESVLYKMPTLFSSNKVDVSQCWDPQYLKRYPPKTYSVYPYFDESETEITTMIHVKNGNGHYGRPDWFAASHDAFLEVKNKEYLLKSVHNNFIGQVLIEVEGDQDNPMLSDELAQEKGWKNSADQWAGNMTNSGGSKEVDQPQSVLIMERPFGSSPVHVHEFNVQTKENFFQKIGNINEDNIIKVNMWSKILQGTDQASGLSGATAFLNELKCKLPLIQHYQNICDNQIINKALDFVGQQLGDQDFIDHNIIHKSPLESIFKDLAEQNSPLKPQPNV